MSKCPFDDDYVDYDDSNSGSFDECPFDDDWDARKYRSDARYEHLIYSSARRVCLTAEAADNLFTQPAATLRNFRFHYGF